MAILWDYYSNFLDFKIFWGRFSKFFVFNEISDLAYLKDSEQLLLTKLFDKKIPNTISWILLFILKRSRLAFYREGKVTYPKRTI